MTEQWRSTDRASVRGGALGVALLLLVVGPLGAQAVGGQLSLRGLEVAPWTPTVAPLMDVPTSGLAAPRPVSTSESRSLRPVAPQAQDSGGFPWLEVGIGAAVGALFIQAVATANSREPAELPRGGITVVLPSS